MNYFCVFTSQWSLFEAAFLYHADALNYTKHNPDRYVIKEKHLSVATDK